MYIWKYFIAQLLFLGNIRFGFTNTENKQVVSPEFLQSYNYELVQEWPDPSVKAIQAYGSGIDLDPDGNIVVFHRGDRTSRSDTFDSQNRFILTNLDPIPVDTVYVINQLTGKILRTWGKNLFYIPHGITVAANRDIFLTDVALHQVFKFEYDPNTSTWNKNAALVLGQAFQPGNDDTHFCKPAAVSVMSDDGDFFVADGYCNSRIIKFNRYGVKLFQWGQSSLETGIKSSAPINTFDVVHGLALAELKHETFGNIFVADRENGRIQSFITSNGSFHGEITSELFEKRLFNVAYSPNSDGSDSGTLFALNSAVAFPKPQIVAVPVNNQVFQESIAVIIKTKEDDTFSGFKHPHDITASSDRNEIYVIEVAKNFTIWKLVKMGSMQSSVEHLTPFLSVLFFSLLICFY